MKEESTEEDNKHVEAFPTYRTPIEAWEKKKKKKKKGRKKERKNLTPTPLTPTPHPPFRLFSFPIPSIPSRTHGDTIKREAEGPLFSLSNQ